MMLVPFYCKENKLDNEEKEVIIEYFYCPKISWDDINPSIQPIIEKIYILGIFKQLTHDTFLLTIQYKDENNDIYEIKTIHQTYHHPNLYDAEKVPFLQYCMLKQNSILSYNEESKNLYCKYNDINTFDLFHDWKKIS